MKRFVPLAALAVALYGALVLTEAFRSGEPFTLLSVVVDLFEMVLLAGAVVMTAFISIEMRDAKHERGALLRDLADARRDGERWRKAARGHVEGLSRAIARQFDEWGLTEAEADVAGLMLKGLSHREIAGLRSGSEATVRQHATAVYRKSGLAGRAQFTGFFLEDLLSPAPADADPAIAVVSDRTSA